MKIFFQRRTRRAKLLWKVGWIVSAVVIATSTIPRLGEQTISARESSGATHEKYDWLSGIDTSLLDAVTVTWNRMAFGQVRTYPCSPGTFNWPDNNNWSQQEVIAIDNACNPPQSYVAQPSNWSTATFPNGLGTDVILTSVSPPTNVNAQVTLSSLTVQEGAGLSIQGTSFLDVQNYNFQGDLTLMHTGGSGFIPYVHIPGIFRKSGGTGVLDLTGNTSSEINNYLTGATVQVDSGTLKLGRSLDTSTGAAFIIADGATLDFNSHSGASAGNYSGTYTGTGGGTFRLNGGYVNIVAPGATFNFVGDLFKWFGGTIGAGPGLTNTGTLNLLGPADKQIDGQSFHNSGLMTQSGSGNLQFGTNSFMFNDADGTYDIRSDSGFNPGGRFDNLGLFKKSAGTGISNIGLPPGGELSFNNLGGTVEVSTGTLRLGRSDSAGGTFSVASGATLELSSESTTGSYSGTYNGSGGGVVELNTGNISSSGSGATFDLPNFHWNGGSISTGPMFNNTGIITMQGSSGWRINGQGFTNSGTMIHAGTAALQWGANAVMTNAASGVYDIRNDGLVTNSGNIRNYGTFRKSAGTGVSTIGLPSAEASFRILGGTVEVTSGTLKLGRSYPESTGGTFIVGAGAVLDLTGASGAACEYTGTYVGHGAGRLELNGGQVSIISPGGTLNFDGDLFQWSGGSFYHSSPDPFNNDGTITVSGNVTSGGFGLTNNGTLKGAGRIEFTGSPSFLANNGTLEAGSPGLPGRLDIAVYSGDIILASASMLRFDIGGTTQGSGYSWLNKIDNRSLTLGGSLNVNLVNGFTPGPTDVFTIVSTQAPLAGGFVNAANGGRLNTADGRGSFRVSYSGPDVVLTDFGPPRLVRADFDGDGRTDVSVFRPSEGNWYLDRSSAGFTGQHWGAEGDVAVPGDYDGDSKTDLAVFRPAPDPSQSDFYILHSSTATVTGVSWGIPGDVPVVGDYDGDGKSDAAVFRPSNSTWYAVRSSNSTAIIEPFGVIGDVPFVMDTDGDRRVQIAVFRPADLTWYIARPNGVPAQDFEAIQFGLPDDRIVAADYDGDNRTDVAVWRPSSGMWYILQSTTDSVVSVAFGISTDEPVPGDYDGDGRDDVAIYRDGQWWMNRSVSGVAIQTFGIDNDVPIPKRYLP